jgi:pimeloyl-ACP methyl ester carboxylesterase
MEFFATCAGIPVYISDSKKGSKIVVLLHGYLETLSVWDDFIPLLDEDIRVIRMDLPGHGLSGSDPTANTMEFSAQVVYEALNKCGVQQATVIGHSMGGYVALAFAEQYPDAVKALCLFHSTPNADSEEKKETRAREIELIRGGKFTFLVEISIPNVFAVDNKERLADKIDEITAIAEEVHNQDGIIASLEGMRVRSDKNTFLGGFKQPLLFIFGKKDQFINLEVAQGLAEKFKQAAVVWLEHSGHCGFIEEPEVCANKINMFVQ